LGEQVTLAHLKEKPAPSTPTASSSSFSASSGVRSAAARLLGGSNGNRALSFVGGNGSSKSNGGASRIGSIGSSSLSSSVANPNFDGKGSYLVFNAGDAILISDLNSQDKVYLLGFDVF
jgi:WD repeat-containing protein 20